MSENLFFDLVQAHLGIGGYVLEPALKRLIDDLQKDGIPTDDFDAREIFRYCERVANIVPNTIQYDRLVASCKEARLQDKLRNFAHELTRTVEHTKSRDGAKKLGTGPMTISQIEMAAHKVAMEAAVKATEPKTPKPDPRPSFSRIYLRGKDRFALDIRLESTDTIPTEIRIPEDIADFNGKIGSYLTSDTFEVWPPRRYPLKIFASSRKFIFDREFSAGSAAHEVYYREV